VYTILRANLIFLGVFRGEPIADRFLERCTNAVASPVGVTGALHCPGIPLITGSVYRIDTQRCE